MRYWHVINQAIKTNPNNILEIGKGNGSVSSYLKNNGFDVTTVDFDPVLKPDIICSIIELSKYLPDKSFDTRCLEVLEHLEFKDFARSLIGIEEVCKNYLSALLPQAVMVLS